MYIRPKLNFFFETARTMAEITSVINDLNTNKAGKHEFTMYVRIAHHTIRSNRSASRAR